MHELNIETSSHRPNEPDLSISGGLRGGLHLPYPPLPVLEQHPLVLVILQLVQLLQPQLLQTLTCGEYRGQLLQTPTWRGYRGQLLQTLTWWGGGTGGQLPQPQLLQTLTWLGGGEGHMISMQQGGTMFE